MAIRWVLNYLLRNLFLKTLIIIFKGVPAYLVLAKKSLFLLTI